MLTVALWLALAAEPAPKPKLVVLSIDANVDPATRAGFDDAIAATVAKTGAFDVVSSREVQVLLGIERQKQLLGCSNDSSSCLAELSGALGARFVLSGALAPLGGTWQLSLQMQDTVKSLTVGRSSRLAKNLDGLRAVLPFAVAEVTGTPPPAPPSKIGPLAMVAGGALLAAIGGTVLFDALTEAAAIRRELEFGSAPRTRVSYLDDETWLQRQANLGVLGLALGGAVLAAGIILWPPDLARGVALVPTPSGAFVVGSSDAGARWARPGGPRRLREPRPRRATSVCLSTGRAGARRRRPGSMCRRLDVRVRRPVRRSRRGRTTVVPRGDRLCTRVAVRARGQ
ncbi:MAG: hypothetical protein SFW67_32560 [Myxococcaceae bacterium]|nr:hypothetical protein [Myxococcaceae bacterium]